MFQRNRSFSVLYGIQRTLLAVFYLVSVLSLFWIIFYLLDDVLGLQGFTIILVTIAYLVLVVLGYSFIHVISYIPSNLAGAFDPVQNAIADGSIQSAGDLARELSAFMVNFFNFAFFDIEYALVKIKNVRSSWPAEKNSGEGGLNIGELDKRNETVIETIYVGKIKVQEKTGHLYLTPMIFGEENLGYIAVITRHRLWKIFMHLLTEFEDHFVDDQVVHILAGASGKLA
ncbi:MAG: hypothetical protein AMS23_09375 [Bacteroides sp. SM1_62]|nr:MAG: hypothetical protein AMS23_09375 [Bacteroides sp. SM1_62]